MTDRELLEAAAKAAGIAIDSIDAAHEPDGWVCWNSLTDDGDALRLVGKLGMQVEVCGKYAKARVWIENGWSTEEHTGGDDVYAATRRAITRAAAADGAAA